MCVNVLDSQVGTCVHAQLAKRANSAEAAVALMKNQPFLIETKFDGNRIQLHYAAGKDGQPIEEWNYLNAFFKRYNKVLLDVMGIERERDRLGNENGDLRSILKQYLDGISVNEDVINNPNPLLVVNGRLVG